MRTFLPILLAFFFANQSFANDKKLNVYISYCTFNSPQDGPYVETYFAFSGKSVNFVPNDNGKLQAKLEVLILLKQNDSIKAFRKYNLNSPEIDDSTKANILFHDQQRISIPNGDYEMEISIHDANSNQAAYIINEPISVAFSSTDVQVSGIELVQSAEKTDGVSASSKAGYELLPLPINIYPPSENKLMFYAEMYNMQKALGDSSQYLLRTYIEEAQTGRKMAGMLYQKRMNSRNVEAFLHQFDITDLPTGTYFLVVEMKDRDNEIIGLNKVYFERWSDKEQYLAVIEDEIIKGSFASNFTGIDSLRESIRSLRPISTANEKNFVDKTLNTADLETLQKFFYNFWYQRNEADPATAWMQYNEQVRIVNANFGSKIRKGYETERGRVYLQYGPPNTITDMPHEPAVYPYQIWHYYSIHNQSNRKFIFVNFDMVTNDFELLHSDVTGELYDIKWKEKLLRRNYTTNDLDEQNPDFGWGSKVNEYFNTPH